MSLSCSLQVKSPAPDNEWTLTEFLSKPAGANVGQSAGISGTMLVDGKEVHVHCGGFDDAIISRDCFAMTVAEDGSIVVDPAAELARPTSWACHGSDSGRFAMAGGFSSSFH